MTSGLKPCHQPGAHRSQTGSGEHVEGLGLVQGDLQLHRQPGTFTMFSPSDNSWAGYPSHEESGVWLFNVRPRITPQNDAWVRLADAYHEASMATGARTRTFTGPLGTMKLAVRPEGAVADRARAVGGAPQFPIHS